MDQEQKTITGDIKDIISEIAALEKEREILYQQLGALIEKCRKRSDESCTDDPDCSFDRRWYPRCTASDAHRQPLREIDQLIWRTRDPVGYARAFSRK